MISTPNSDTCTCPRCTGLCPCGSGLPFEEETDARGIYIGRMCDKCRTERLRGFRPEVLTDPAYEADEPIDPD
jgi:hypothetical protein